MKLATLFLLMIPLTASAAEPQVRDGLVLRFDAAAQAALRQRDGLPFLGRQQPVDMMLDSSSTHATASAAHQCVPEASPVFIPDGTSPYVRFDGKDDFLSLVSGRPPAAGLTVFILVAPTTNAGNFSALFWGPAFGH